MRSVETNLKRVIVGRVMPGEDLIQAIIKLAKKNEIKAGFINVIGAFNKFTIGYFDIDIRQYNFKTYEEQVEIISCTGNIAYKEREPVIHIHVSVGRGDYSLIGGHLSQPSIISVTGEVLINEIEQQLTRSNDLHFKIPLLDI